MQRIALNALDEAVERGADYADVRVVERRVEDLQVKNGLPERIATVEDLGLSVRVLSQGAWGLAATNELGGDALAAAVSRALDIAAASARVQTSAAWLPSRPGEVGSYTTPMEQDPFAVPLEHRLALLVTCCEAMQRPSVRVAQAHMNLFREHKWFVSSEGCSLEQVIVENGGGTVATAVGQDSTFQRRSFENHAQGGYEFILSLDLPAQAERCADEAEALLMAPVCPSGPRSIVLGSSLLALQVHESCGHPIELDRALGSEASYAGTSFMTVDQLGLLQYGSPLINITADATQPGGLGTFGWDDEGTPAEAFPVIKEGRFVNYLTSRETAWWLAHHHSPACPVPPLPFSNGTMRADGWSHLPLIRMTNISLEPGSWSGEELLADTEGGLFLDTPKSWSLDDKRLNFHFGAEVAYEIEGGRLGRLLRDGSYTDRTPRFWNSCDAVCNERVWRLWGLPSCAKGEPMQVAHVAHGAAPARFRGVEVRGGG